MVSHHLLRLVVAGADFGLHLLTKSSSGSEDIYSFGGGLSGHHGKVNDMVFCGGWDEDSARYVATVSGQFHIPYIFLFCSTIHTKDDKMLMVWDLYPTIDIPSPHESPLLEKDFAMSPSPERPQPTAYVIPFPCPLTTIRSHPATSKEFLVADAHGSIFLTDWRSDPEDGEDGVLRHSSLVELVEPTALSKACMAGTTQWSASVDWRTDAIDMYAVVVLLRYRALNLFRRIGGVFGPKFALWDISKLRGGTPNATGTSFAEGGQLFRYASPLYWLLQIPTTIPSRWCQTHTEYFAISTRSPTNGALLHVHNCSYVHAPPTPFALRPKPHFVRDFDFLALPGIPRIAAAVGRTVIIFPIGVDT